MDNENITVNPDEPTNTDPTTLPQWVIPPFPEFIELPEDEEEEPKADDYTIERKYFITDEERIIDIDEETAITVYRIRACRDFGQVHEGDLGGFVENELNLSHEGNCWIYDNAVVAGDAAIYHDAMVRDDARVLESAVVTHNAKVLDGALVKGDAVIEENAVIRDRAIVTDEASVTDKARVEGMATLADTVRAAGETVVRDYALVTGDTWLQGHTVITDSGRIFTGATLDGYSILQNNQAIIENFNIALLTALADLKLSERDYKTLFDFWTTDFIWKVRQGKPFKFMPYPITTSCKIEIAKAPVEETEQEWFHPSGLFLSPFRPEPPELDPLPDIPNEPIEPEIPKEGDDDEENNGDNEQPTEPVQEEDGGNSDESKSEQESESGSEEFGDIEESPSESGNDNNVDGPVDEEPSAEDEEPYVYGVFEPDTEFTVEEPTVFYIKVSSSEKAYRIYSVQLLPVPYGVRITIVDPQTGGEIPSFDITDYVEETKGEIDPMTEFHVIPGKESYSFLMDAYTRCKISPFGQVEEKLLYDKRCPDVLVPRTAWIRLGDSAEIRPDDEMFEFGPWELEKFADAVAQTDDETSFDGHVTMISFSCSTEDDQKLSYNYNLPEWPKEYKPENDLTNRRATDADGADIPLWPAHKEADAIGDELGAYRTLEIADVNHGFTDTFTISADAVRRCDADFGYVTGPSKSILNAQFCYDVPADKVLGKLTELTDVVEMTFTDAEEMLWLIANDLAKDGNNLDQSLGLIYAMHMSTRDVTTAIHLLRSLTNPEKDFASDSVREVVELVQRKTNWDVNLERHISLYNLITRLDKYWSDFTSDEQTAVSEYFSAEYPDFIRTFIENSEMAEAGVRFASHAKPIAIEYEINVGGYTQLVTDDECIIEGRLGEVVAGKPVMGYAVETSVEMELEPNQLYLFMLPQIPELMNGFVETE